MDPVRIPYIPESAPFTPEQRAWLNGFLAGLFAQAPITGQQPAPATPPPPGEPLLIMFGSQTGTAENLAKKIAKDSQKRGFAPTVLPLNDYLKANLSDARNLLIVSSTWGDGDPPDNAVEFWRWLSAENTPRLENLHYAVLGLGDRNYSDFCGASKKFDARLTQLGARPLLPRVECDVDYETPARQWCDQLWSRLHPANGASTNGTAALNGATHSLEKESQGFSKSNPFPAPLLRNLVLNGAGSAKEVRHYEFSLAGSGLTYQVGDALGVVPQNCPGLVEEFLRVAKCGGDELLEHSGKKAPFRELLLKSLDITRPSPDLLAAVGKSAPDCELAALLPAERSSELKKWLIGRDVIDVLALASAPFAPEDLVRLLRKLAPRLYSISSSPKAHPDEVHLTVGTVRYEALGRKRKGVCSTFLADQCKSAPVFVHSSPGFKPPAKPETPMIMVGPGTGIAPFRAFLEERQASGSTGKNWLFFGDQTRHADFLYEEQIAAWQKRGHLTRLDLAFSRDQEAKLYVQHRMLENAAELWGWLEEGAHFYVCGDASRMARDVDDALHKVVESAGARSADDAKAYVAKLKSQKRYQRDVY
jgi:sulfite reductase (NADPH) flavoprotein alpha-component